MTLDAVGENYPSAEDMASHDRAVDFVPDLLKLFLRSLLTGKDINLKLAFIGQAVVQGTRPRVIMAPTAAGSRGAITSPLFIQVSYW